MWPIDISAACRRESEKEWKINNNMIECDVKVFFSLSFYIFFPAVNKLVELVLLAIKPWNDRNDKIIAILFIFHLTITLTFILLSYQVRCFFCFVSFFFLIQMTLSHGFVDYCPLLYCFCVDEFFLWLIVCGVDVASVQP